MSSSRLRCGPSSNCTTSISRRGGLTAVKVKLRLSNGQMYEQQGHIDYVDPTVSTTTDTLIVRANIPNPLLPGMRPDETGNRELVDGEFVTAIVESIEPVEALVIPRVALLANQQGNYVYVVDADNKAQSRQVTLGQSSASTAVVSQGLHEGDMVITEGLQLVRPGNAVQAHPAGAPPGMGPGSAAIKPSGS